MYNAIQTRSWGEKPAEHLVLGRLFTTKELYGGGPGNWGEHCRHICITNHISTHHHIDTTPSSHEYHTHHHMGTLHAHTPLIT